MSKKPICDNDAIAYARSFCLRACEEYWKTVRKESGVRWKIRSYGETLPKISEIDSEVILDISAKFNKLNPENAGYLISIRYMNLLPKQYRANNGVFYTPMHVVEKMLSDAENAGIDFKTAKVIDPAAGGAAYLSPLCRRLIKGNYKSDQALVDDITKRLVGFEIDPFSAWLSQFVLDCTLAYVAPSAKKPPSVIHTINSLEAPESFFGQFDYVIGNPPYGKTSLNKEILGRYADIISGKPNLYQLFYKLAFLLVRDKGYVHFITPTGFIGGSYFHKLRVWVESKSFAVSFSFFDKRLGVFPGVQQELVISLFKKASSKRHPQIFHLENNGDIKSKRLGRSPLFKDGTWILPRSKEAIQVGKLFLTAKNNIQSYGYILKTGYVVPHRSDGLLTDKKSAQAHPLIRSESISEFPVIEHHFGELGQYQWYSGKTKAGLHRSKAILIKRTSSKEQARRIHTAIVGQSFLNKYGGFFAENHVNVLTSGDSPPVSLEVLDKLLNTQLFDDLFRCSNGTVTVSASELKALPLPSYEGLKLFERLLLSSESIDIEAAAWKAYGVDA